MWFALGGALSLAVRAGWGRSAGSGPRQPHVMSMATTGPPPPAGADGSSPVDSLRVQTLRPAQTTAAKPPAKAVVYWMGRDQRVADNWALLHAQHEALAHKLPLHVVFTLTSQPGGHNTLRRLHFLLEGLKEVRGDLRGLDVAFHVLPDPDPAQAVARFARAHAAGLVVAPRRRLRSYCGKVSFVAGLVVVLRPFLARLWAPLSEGQPGGGARL